MPGPLIALLLDGLVILAAPDAGTVQETWSRLRKAEQDLRMRPPPAADLPAACAALLGQATELIAAHPKTVWELRGRWLAWRMESRLERHEAALATAEAWLATAEGPAGKEENVFGLAHAVQATVQSALACGKRERAQAALACLPAPVWRKPPPIPPEPAPLPPDASPEQQLAHTRAYEVRMAAEVEAAEIACRNVQDFNAYANILGQILADQDDPRALWDAFERVMAAQPEACATIKELRAKWLQQIEGRRRERLSKP
jgi:hypothetical protein